VFYNKRPGTNANIRLPSIIQMKFLVGKTALLFLVSGIVCTAGEVVICLWTKTGFNNLSYVLGLSVILLGSILFFDGTHKKPEFSWLIILYLFGVINMAAGHFIVFDPRLREILFRTIIGRFWALNRMAMLLRALYLNRRVQIDSFLDIASAFPSQPVFMSCLISQKVLRPCYRPVSYMNFHMVLLPCFWQSGQGSGAKYILMIRWS
jgi:hypothetical protein